MKLLCSACGFRLPPSSFYRDAKGRNGLSYHCKECAKTRARAWQRQNKARHTAQSAAWRAANPERQKVIQDRQARTPAGKANARTYRQRNREKVRARGTIHNHLRYGKLVRQPCRDCGGRAQAHHDDYSKPLDVIWLCQKCHAAFHAKQKGKH